MSLASPPLLQRGDCNQTPCFSFDISSDSLVAEHGDCRAPPRPCVGPMSSGGTRSLWQQREDQPLPPPLTTNPALPDAPHRPASVLKAYYWRESSLLKTLWVSQKRQQAGFPGDRLRGVVSRLFPYSNYKLEMVVVNGRGDGPRSETKEFTTPEGGRSDLQLFRVGQVKVPHSSEHGHGARTAPGDLR